MVTSRHQERVERCAGLMKASGLDALLLTKPANMFYLTGDGRLCAYAMISQGGRVALGVPMTDVEDVRALARFDHITGFENEVGMIHSIAHHFKEFGIQQGTVGFELTFLTQAMMGMLTHPHAKPKEVSIKDCTHILSELRLIKDADEIARIRIAARVGDIGMRAALEVVQPGIEETQVAAEAELAMRIAGLEVNVVLAVGNCGIYTDPWGVRVEDTVAVGVEGPEILTVYPRNLVRVPEPGNSTDFGMIADGG